MRRYMAMLGLAITLVCSEILAGPQVPAPVPAPMPIPTPIPSPGPMPTQMRFGAVVTANPEALGVTVVGVQPGMPATRINVQRGPYTTVETLVPGDVITHLNGRPIYTVYDYSAAVASVPYGGVLTISGIDSAHQGIRYNAWVQLF